MYVVSEHVCSLYLNSVQCAKLCFYIRGSCLIKNKNKNILLLSNFISFLLLKY